jgi:hypothetical protein
MRGKDMKQAIKHPLFALVVAAGTLALAQQGEAASCINGVYRAGCAGPNGAAVVHKTTPTYRAKPAVTCVNGVHHAGCVGPNGAAGVRKAY